MARRRKRKKSYKRRSQSHRVAPMPLWFQETPWGCCRWCNKTIFKDDGVTENKRRRWHPDCLHDYLIITDHRYAKRQVKKRDKGICASCGTYCRYRDEWNLDHEKPLIDAKGDLSFWRIENLQTLCVKCHSGKTVAENIERGKGWFGRHKKNNVTKNG